MPFERWLLEGLIYALILCFVILVSKIIHARLWINDYPKPVRAAAATLTRREKLAKKILDIPLLILQVGYPVFSGFVYKAVMGQAYNMWYGFIHLLVLYNVFTIVDLLLLDGFVVCFVTPRFVMLDGTCENKDVYKDFNFYAKKALKRFGISLIFTALVTGMLTI